jgi:hypothetical protein
VGILRFAILAVWGEEERDLGLASFALTPAARPLSAQTPIPYISHLETG